MPQANVDAADPGPGHVPEANQPGHHPPVEQDKPTGPPPGPRAATDPGPAPVIERFAFRFEPLLLPMAAAFGVLPMTTGVDVEDDVTIRFGPWRMRFPRADVVDVEESGPYQLVKVAGPPRLSLADRGITFATNRQEGLCIRLARPHRGIDPLGLLRHKGVTVTVEGTAALGEALLRR